MPWRAHEERREERIQSKSALPHLDLTFFLLQQVEGLLVVGGGKATDMRALRSSVHGKRCEDEAHHCIPLRGDCLDENQSK